MPRPDIREIAGRLRVMARDAAQLLPHDVARAAELCPSMLQIAADLDAALEGATVLVGHLKNRRDVDHLLVEIPLEDDHA